MATKSNSAKFHLIEQNSCNLKKTSLHCSLNHQRLFSLQLFDYSARSSANSLQVVAESLPEVEVEEKDDDDELRRLCHRCRLSSVDAPDPGSAKLSREIRIENKLSGIDCSVTFQLPRAKANVFLKWQRLIYRHLSIYLIA